MIITIDTQKDSPETMRKTAAFLQDLANGGSNSYGGHTPSPDGSADMFSMFADDSKPEEKEKPQEQVHIMPY